MTEACALYSIRVLCKTKHRSLSEGLWRYRKHEKNLWYFSNVTACYWRKKNRHVLPTRKATEKGMSHNACSQHLGLTSQSMHSAFVASLSCQGHGKNRSRKGPGNETDYAQNLQVGKVSDAWPMPSWWTPYRNRQAIKCLWIVNWFWN